MKTLKSFSGKNLFAAAVLLPLILSGCATNAQNPAADNGGITDAQIRDVVARVAKHQLHPLAEGDYAAVQSVAEAQAAKPPLGIEWNYPRGVELYGLLRSTDLLGGTNVDEFVIQHNVICANDYVWLAGLEKLFGATNLAPVIHDSKLNGLMVLGKLDNCGAMGNALVETMLRYPDRTTPAEKIVADRVANWVLHQQERLPDGTMWRPAVMGGTVWPDDLYMGGVFQVRWGIYQHDVKLIEDTANQIIHQAALEQDADGLWYHGYFVAEKTHAPFKWGRGNGWVTVTLVETLSALPENDSLRAPLLAILRKQIDGLKKLQAPDGLWRQVLDKPELWEETSCTAMFAYGIARAVNRGWIDGSNMVIARRAFAGVAKNVTAEGVVNGTCIGTGIGRTLDFYIKRTQPVDDPHGRGITLLAGTEILLAGKK
jgi:unsaturated rhamnogalacturonyl hydrolase